MLIGGPRQDNGLWKLDPAPTPDPNCPSCKSETMQKQISDLQKQMNDLQKQMDQLQQEHQHDQQKINRLEQEHRQDQQNIKEFQDQLHDMQQCSASDWMNAIMGVVGGAGATILGAFTAETGFGAALALAAGVQTAGQVVQLADCFSK